MVFCVRSTSAQCVGQGQHPLAPRKEPEVGTPEVPTMGSRNHRLGSCRPCVPRHEKTGQWRISTISQMNVDMDSMTGIMFHFRGCLRSGNPKLFIADARDFSANQR